MLALEQVQLHRLGTVAALSVLEVGLWRPLEMRQEVGK